MASAAGDELGLYSLAYLHLFRAVLNRKQSWDEFRKNSVISEIQEYLKTHINSPDAFIDHLPWFADKLNVDVNQLSAFVGSNFLKALQTARQSPGSDSIALEQNTQSFRRNVRDLSIFDELVQSLQVQSPGRFVAMDYGLLKLILPDGTAISGQSAEDPALASSSGSQGGESGLPAGKAGAPAIEPERNEQLSSAYGVEAVGQVQAVRKPAVLELSIIQEILEKFGSILDIREALVINAAMDDSLEDGPEEQSGQTASPAPLTHEAPALKTNASNVPVAEKLPSWFSQDPPIIQDILNRFGTILNIQGKLILPEDGAIGVIYEDEGGEGTTSGQSPETTFFRLEMSFDGYQSAMKQIQSFQTRQDREGYKRWITSEATLSVKVLVMLRNMEGRIQKGEQLDRKNEMSAIAQRSGLAVESVEDLHRRAKPMEALQGVIARFTRRVQAEEQPVSNAARFLWPQIRQMLIEETDQNTMISESKIMLLQIPDPVTREKLRGLLESVFKDVSDIYAPPL